MTLMSNLQQGFSFYFLYNYIQILIFGNKYNKQNASIFLIFYIMQPMKSHNMTEHKVHSNWQSNG